MLIIKQNGLCLTRFSSKLLQRWRQLKGELVKAMYAHQDAMDHLAEARKVPVYQIFWKKISDIFTFYNYAKIK